MTTGRCSLQLMISHNNKGMSCFTFSFITHSLPTTAVVQVEQSAGWVCLCIGTINS